MPATIKELIRDIIGEGRTATLPGIRKRLRESRIEFSDEELLVVLRELQSEGVLSIIERPVPATFSSYLVDQRSWWVFAIFAVPVAEILLVAIDSGDSMLEILRKILGLGLLGFLPGYSSQRALFPDRELTILERVVLSIFLSVVISISIGLALGAVYAFSAGPNVFFLSVYVQSVTLAAGYRSFEADRKRALGLSRH